MSVGQEIVVRKSSDIAQLDELEQILLRKKEAPQFVDDPESISLEIIAQLLGAESDEELESIGKATAWSELFGVPVEIRGFTWRPSSYEQGSPVFFVVQATRLDDGSKVVLTTGAGNVLAQLTNMARRGTLVGAVRILEESDEPTAQGFRPQWLRAVPKTVEEEARKKGEAKA